MVSRDYDIELVRVFGCVRCGWLFLESVQGCDDISDHAKAIRISGAPLKSFAVESDEAPVAALIRYIRERPETVHHVNSTTLERLVGSVFAEHFGCEVRHVGRTADGGGGPAAGDVRLHA
jgi:hypothetical protein